MVWMKTTGTVGESNTERLVVKVQLVGDDFFVTNAELPFVVSKKKMC